MTGFTWPRIRLRESAFFLSLWEREFFFSRFFFDVCAGLLALGSRREKQRRESTFFSSSFLCEVYAALLCFTWGRFFVGSLYDRLRREAFQYCAPRQPHEPLWVPWSALLALLGVGFFLGALADDRRRREAFQYVHRASRMKRCEFFSQLCKRRGRCLRTADINSLSLSLSIYIYIHRAREYIHVYIERERDSWH